MMSVVDTRVFALYPGDVFTIGTHRCEPIFLVSISKRNTRGMRKVVAIDFLGTVHETQLPGDTVVRLLSR
jgi:hypothetical protein